MKNIYKALLKVSILAMLIFSLQFSFAGNKDRSGQAAAQHLLISPWGASNGWGTVGISSTGVEATFSNVGNGIYTKNRNRYTIHCIVTVLPILISWCCTILRRERGNLGLSVMIMV